MAEGPWSDDENDAIVAVYFLMLADDLFGRPYTRAVHVRSLQAQVRRSRGSIEFKHANISAALKGFGQPNLRGYLPRFNFQMSLAEAIDRWIAANPDWIERLPRASPAGMSAHQAPIFFDPAPTKLAAAGGIRTDAGNRTSVLTWPGGTIGIACSGAPVKNECLPTSERFFRRPDEATLPTRWFG
jgi:hypothetical protein